MKLIFAPLLAISIAAVCVADRSAKMRHGSCGNATDYWFTVPGGTETTSLMAAISAVGTFKAADFVGAEEEFEMYNAFCDDYDVNICAFSVSSSKVVSNHLRFGVFPSDVNCVVYRP